MKKLNLIVLIPLLFLPATAMSQLQENENEDEVIASATVQRDPAMTAWNAGDFATAEIEFERNAFCALRAERNFISGLESARESSINSDISSNVNLSFSPDGSGGTATTTVPSDFTNRSNSARKKQNETPSKRTCEDRGFQLYMMGLSQLKLGKRHDAKATLIRAAKMRKNLYDAHFRIALMEYQDGNLDKTEKHYRKLRKLQPKCKKCDAEAEIAGQIKYLERLLK